MTFSSEKLEFIRKNVGALQTHVQCTLLLFPIKPLNQLLVAAYCTTLELTGVYMGSKTKSLSETWTVVQQ